MATLLVACGGLFQQTPPPPASDAGSDATPLVDVGSPSDVTFDSTGACSGAPIVSFAPKDVLSFPVIGLPRQLALGDVDGDGRLDIVLHETSYPQNKDTTLVFIQDASGHFPSVSYSYIGDGATWALGDVTNDGRVDVVGASGSSVVVRAGNANGGLDSPAYYPFGAPSGVPVIGDFDGDSVNDVVIESNPCSGCVTTIHLLPQVNGVLGADQSMVTTSTTFGVGGDVNSDGLLDLVGVQPGQKASPLVVVPGLGANGFGAAFSVPFEGQTLTQGYLAVGDVTGDGANDVIVVPDGYPSVVLVSAQQAGALQPPASYASSEAAGAVALGDVNNDCLVDVAVVHPGWSTIGVYLQNANATLASEVPLESILWIRRHRRR